jgi:hypothetical protein
MFQITGSIAKDAKGTATEFWDNLHYNLQMKSEDSVASNEEIVEIVQDQYQSVQEMRGEHIDPNAATKSQLLDIFKEYFMTIPGEYMISLWKEFSESGFHTSSVSMDFSDEEDPDL